jgi:hypothetical protein
MDQMRNGDTVSVGKPEDNACKAEKENGRTAPNGF